MTRAIWNAWSSALDGIELSTRHSDAATNFANRDYWFRLWIVQGLATTDYKLEVLCGRDKVSWIPIALLSNLLNNFFGPMQTSASMWVVKSCSHPCPRRMFLKNINHLTLCTDHRDRLYGLSSPIGCDAVPIGLVLLLFHISLVAFGIEVDGEETIAAAHRRQR